MEGAFRAHFTSARPVAESALDLPMHRPCTQSRPTLSPMHTARVQEQASQIRRTPENIAECAGALPTWVQKTGRKVRSRVRTRDNVGPRAQRAPPKRHPVRKVCVLHASVRARAAAVQDESRHTWVPTEIAPVLLVVCLQRYPELLALCRSKRQDSRADGLAPCCNYFGKTKPDRVSLWLAKGSYWPLREIGEAL